MKLFLAVVLAILTVASGHGAGGIRCQSIGLKNFFGKFVQVHADGTAANGNSLRGWETIKVIPMGGKVALKSYFNKLLSAQPSGKAEWNRTVAKGWETFEVKRVGDKVAFKSFFGKYLSAQPNGSLQANRNSIKGWELFEVYPRGCLASWGH